MSMITKIATRKKLRQATELGISMTILATLLSGCLGGSGGGGAAVAPAALTTTTTLAPFKGSFTSGSVALFDANNNKIGATSTIKNGVATVTYPQSAAYPIRVEVTGTYHNELKGAPETITKPLRGFILDQATALNSNSAISGVPVTAYTEMAVAQLADASGVLPAITGASAVAALNTVEIQLGLQGGTTHKTPQFDAATGETTDPDTLILASLSSAAASGAAAGTTMLDAIVSLANQLKTLPAASAPSDIAVLGTLPAAYAAIKKNILPASATVPVFTMPTASASSVSAIQSAVVATSAQGAIDAAARDAMLAEGSTNGLRGFTPGWIDPVATQQPSSWVSHLQAGNITVAAKVLINKVWSAITGTVYHLFVLASTGWVDANTQTNKGTYLLNADGTVTMTQDGYGSYRLQVSSIDLSGTPIASAVGAVDANGMYAFGGGPAGPNNSASSVIPASAMFPAGSIGYTENPVPSSVTLQDIYQVVNDVWSSVVDANGAAVTTLGGLNTEQCNGYNAVIKRTSATSANVYLANTQGFAASAVSVQCPIIAAASASDATLTLSTHTVNGVTLEEVTAVTPASAVQLQSVPVYPGRFATVLNGKVVTGNKIPVGTPAAWVMGGRQHYNKKAMDAIMAAIGLPAF